MNSTDSIEIDFDLKKLGSKCFWYENFSNITAMIPKNKYRSDKKYELAENSPDQLQIIKIDLLEINVNIANLNGDKDQ